MGAILFFQEIHKNVYLGREEFFGHIEEQLKHLHSLKDDRALVLVGALLVEYYLDELLSSYIPDYKNQLSRWTLFVKTTIARALKLCPDYLYDSIDTIREIRNKFAHNLDVKNIEDLSNEYIKSLKSHLNQYLTGPVYESIINDVKKVRIFDALIGNVTVTLRSYGLQIQVLNDFIRSDEIYEILNRKVASE